MQARERQREIYRESESFAARDENEMRFLPKYNFLFKFKNRVA